MRFGKIFMAIVLMSCGVFFFQNCKVQKNEDGDIQTVQALPVDVDIIEFSKGLSSALEESAEHLKIDFVNNKIIGHKRDLNSSDESLCQKSVDMDANLRADILEKYDRAHYCFRTIKAEPGTVCTLQLKMTDNFSLSKGESVLLKDRVGTPDACYSGVAMEFCNGGEEFYELLIELRKDMMNLCL